MCMEEGTIRLLPTLLHKATEAIMTPISFFRFVEQIEKLSDKLLFMLDEEKEAYQRCWWDMQEVALTLFRPWSDFGEPNHWDTLMEYNQQAKYVTHKFILFCIKYYLATIQLVMNKASNAIHDFDSFSGFAIGLYTLKESLVFLSENEQEVLLSICSDLEVLALPFIDMIDVNSKYNLWRITLPQIMEDYHRLMNFLQKHQVDIINQYE